MIIKKATAFGELYDDFESAYEKNHLVQIIKRHRPEVIVDCVNTATGLSYQMFLMVLQSSRVDK